MKRKSSAIEKKWPANAVEMRPVSSLVPYARNAKRHPEGQIKRIMASIKEWGWTVPVLLDEDGEMIAGHGRLEAAQRLELKEIPCMVASGWTPAQKKAYRIADNRLAQLGDWDADLLKIELEEIGELGFDVEFTGFDPAEMAQENYTDDMGVPEPDPNVMVRLSIPASVWLGKRQEILDMTSRMERAYLAKVKIDE